MVDKKVFGTLEGAQLLYTKFGSRLKMVASSSVTKYEALHKFFAFSYICKDVYIDRVNC